MSATPRSLLAITLVCVAIVVCVVSWISFRARNLGVTVPVAQEARFARTTDDLTPAGAADSVSRTATAVAQVETSTPQAPPATGRLRLHVVDAASGAPIAGATCVVYCERNGPKTYGTLTTDDEGRAAIGELPENTILVRVNRQRQYARKYAGVWLRAGESRELEIRVGAGGTIVGRVVDDLGAPLEGVEVFLLSDTPDKQGQPDLRTGSDGRFELERVVSSPQAVWIVDDAMRPGSWNPVRLRFVAGVASEWAEIQIEEGKRVDIGDIVLNRPNVLAGRLLDARRAPVPGAFVTSGSSPLDLRKAVLRSRAQTELGAAGDKYTRTRLDGSFDIESKDGSFCVTVATMEGITQWFPLPVLEIGEARRDLELLLDDVVILEIELLDEQGIRVSRQPRTAATKDVYVRSRISGSDARLQTRIAWEDGTGVSGATYPDEDGVFRIQLPGSKPPKRMLQLELPGFVPVSTELDPPPEGLVDRQRFTLRQTPCLHVHLKIDAQERKSGPTQSAHVMVQACLLSPDVFTSTVRTSPNGCCGLGSVFLAPLKAIERDIDLPVRSENERFWIHVLVLQPESSQIGSRQQPVVYESHMGPFAPDSSRHRVEIPAVELIEGGSPEAGKQEEFHPPAVSFPANELVKPKVAEAPPLMKTRIRIVESDGKPLAKSSRATLLLQTPTGTGSASGIVADDTGSVRYPEEYHGPCSVYVKEGRHDALIGDLFVYQIVHVDSIEAAASTPIVLAPWRSVEIRVSGDVTGLPQADLRVQITQLDLPDSIDSRLSHGWPVEAHMGADQVRRFRTFVAPGKYEISLTPGLFKAPKIQVDVRNADGLQVFELVSTR